jgi:hypothetical protein
MGFADRPAIELDRVSGQGVGNGLARRAGDDVVPHLAHIGVLPEIGLECGHLRHAFLPFAFCRLAEFVVSYSQVGDARNQASRNIPAI